MPTLESLQQDIDQIKERNQKVELDKAWETSWTRRGVLLLLTYLVIVVFFLFADLPNPWINAIVPALAFVISTLTLSIFKKMWMKRH